MLCAAAAVMLCATAAGTGANATGITEAVDGPGTARPAAATLSFRPWVSADGRTVAFDSNAVLAPGAVRGVRNL
jgi:hypothetical protein